MIVCADQINIQVVPVMYEGIQKNGNNAKHDFASLIVWEKESVQQFVVVHSLYGRPGLGDRVEAVPGACPRFPRKKSNLGEEDSSWGMFEYPPRLPRADGRTIAGPAG